MQGKKKKNNKVLCTEIQGNNNIDKGRGCCTSWQQCLLEAQKPEKFQSPVQISCSRESGEEGMIPREGSR